MYMLMDVYAWNILLSFYHSKAEEILSISFRYILSALKTNILTPFLTQCKIFNIYQWKVNTLRVVLLNLKVYSVDK